MVGREIIVVVLGGLSAGDLAVTSFRCLVGMAGVLMSLTFVMLLATTAAPLSSFFAETTCVRGEEEAGFEADRVVGEPEGARPDWL